MSNFPGYKTKAFSPSQKFFVLDPNTGSPSFVQGSDLVSQLTPNSNYVYAESTRTNAQATDYALGSVIQTGGATSVGDNEAGVYLVVPSGEGDFPMDNGNELLVLAGDDTLREQLAENTEGYGSDLVAHTGTSDTVTETLDRHTAEIDKRTIFVGSVAELEALSLAGGTNAVLTEELKGGPFVLKVGDLSAEVTNDPQQGVYIAAFSDPTGASGAWMRLYDALTPSGGLQGGWFGMKDAAGFDNSTAMQAAIDYSVLKGILAVKGMAGNFEISQTVNFHTTGIMFEMAEGSKTHTGGSATGAKLIWTGGAVPMMRSTTSQITFRGFTIENQGTATDWLELNSGSQNNIYEDIYCIASNSHTAFSRSVIRSNGNRVGYSQFRHVVCNSGAPVFLDIDGQGTPNGITPIHFGERCLFGSNVAPLTVIKLQDEVVENIDIRNCTFNQFGFELTVFDSSGTPAAVAVNTFSFCDNELDASVSDDSAWRFFKFENVDNIVFTGNTVNSGGSKLFNATLVNSNVAQFEGNKYTSLVTAFFDADDDSKVVSGINKGSSRPAFVNVNSGIVNLTYGAGVSVDGREMCPHKLEILHLDVTSSSGYTINIDTTTPEYITVSQVFTIAVRNVSGGAIVAPSFGSTFETAGATTAPADGFGRLYTFYWSGSKAIEISRVNSDVANS